jgi:hypothetical protein
LSGEQLPGVIPIPPSLHDMPLGVHPPAPCPRALTTSVVATKRDSTRSATSRLTPTLVAPRVMTDLAMVMASRVGKAPGAIDGLASLAQSRCICEGSLRRQALVQRLKGAGERAREGE